MHNPLSLGEFLRAAIDADHESVDAAFGRFDLSSPEGYRSFLQAQALAVPPVEAALVGHAELPSWQPRAPLLHQDLAALDEAMPPPLDFPPLDSAAAAWGALYVMEGSRLGGAVLAKQIASGSPGGFLGARHKSGGWRAFRAALEQAAGGQGDAWRDEALAGAKAVFALFRTAASM